VSAAGWLAGVTLLLVIGGAPKPAPRSAEADADAAIEQGIRFREKGEDQKALELFERAYQLTHSPRALTQVALAEQALGRWIEAEVHLVEALGTATKDRWIRAHKSALEGGLTEIQSHLAKLELNCNIKGAELRIATKSAGHFPFAEPLRVIAGPVAIEVSAAGYQTVSRNLIAGTSSVAKATIVLLPSPPPPAPTPQVAVVEARAEPSSSLPWPWMLAGGSAVALGVGIAEGVIREGHASDYNRAHCPTDSICSGARSGVYQAQTIATIAFIGGGALAVGAVLDLLFSGE
jgi:hypothetical protein